MSAHAYDVPERTLEPVASEDRKPGAALVASDVATLYRTVERLADLCIDNSIRGTHVQLHGISALTAKQAFPDGTLRTHSRPSTLRPDETHCFQTWNARVKDAVVVTLFLELA